MKSLAQNILTHIPKWCINLFFLILTAIFFIWRYKYGLQRYFDIDEFAHLHWAHNAFIGQHPYTDFFYFFPPIYLYLLSSIFLFVGKSVAILILARRIAFIISLLTAVVLFFLVREVKDTKTALLATTVFAFLPIPLDKWIEMRPDTAAVLFSLLGLFFLVRTLKRPRMREAFLAGFFLLLAVGVVPKVIFFPVVAAITVIIYAYIHRDKSGIKKQIIFVQMWRVKVLKGFVLGVCLITITVLILLFHSGNIPKAILLTTKIASSATDVLAHKFYILPNFLFYPNDAYYGSYGYSPQWILNFIIWMTAIVWAVIHIVSSLNTKNSSASLIKFLLGVTFYANLYAFVNLFLLHHEQYLLPLSPFIAYYFADLVISIVEAVKNRAGKFLGIVLELILLVSFGYALFHAGEVMYWWRLSWTGNRLSYYEELYQELPDSEPIFDLTGETIFARDGYYFCCIPYGQYEEALTFPIPGIANALRKNRVRLIYTQDIGRIGVLPIDQQKVIREHYIQLPDGTKPYFLYAGSTANFPGIGVEHEIDLIASGRFDIYWNGKKFQDVPPSATIKIDGTILSYSPVELSAGTHLVKTSSAGELKIVWSGS